jgi:hypothetical protein
MMLSRFTRLSRWSTAACVSAGLVWLMHGPVAAASGQSHEQASTTDSIGAGASRAWQALTPAQKKVLQPLAPHWSTLDRTSREKWLNVANRFERLSPSERQRVQERMDQWAKLPAQQRGEARLRFQQTRQISPDERQRKWTAYQALSPEDRQDLTRQAERKSKPIFLSDSAVGPREARQAYSPKRRSRADTSPEKSNMVPNAGPGMVSTRTVIRPAIVKAGTGATTSLVNQRPTPPLHQQTGLPKIAATKGFVDPVTLLPRKGAQGAAMTPTPQERRADTK